MDARHRKNALAFLDAFASAVGEKPRPLGYLTISNMRLLGLKIGDSAALALLTPMQRRDQIHALLWIFCAPLAEVSRGLRAHERLLAAAPDSAFEEFTIAHVEPWLAGIDPEKLEHGFSLLAQMDEIDAASVTAEPPDRAEKKSAAPAETPPT